jgi:hypothetical protein
MDTRIAITICALAACSTTTSSSSGTKSAGAAGGNASLLRLERGSCFGKCPSYVLEVDTDGHVRFEGALHVCTSGRVSRQLDPAKVREVRSAIARFKFATIPIHCCDCPVTDTSIVTLTVADSGPARTILDTEGCEGGPASVRALANAIDDIVGTKRWIEWNEEGYRCEQ